MIYFQTIDRCMIEPIIFDMFEEQRLEAFGERYPKDEKVISLGVYDRDRVIGGIVAIINYYEMEVKYLGIHKEYRNLKLGNKLIEQVEEMAAGQGVMTVTLTTQDYQAREFYEQQGYTLFGQLDNVPRPNEVRCYFSKTIGKAPEYR